MTTLSYIVLANSTASISKRFRVVFGSLQKVINKAETRKRSLTGKADVQLGAVFGSWAMTLRMHVTDPDGAAYGTLANLETLYSYVNPAASPSNVITFTDHLNQAHTVHLVGSFSEEQLTPYLDGTAAAFLVPIAMEEVL